jgi:allophanate hydrolase subunit 1
VGDLVEDFFVLAIHGRGRYHHAVELAPAGDRAVLVSLGDVTAEELHACAARVREVTGVLAVIPGHSSLYVIGGAPDAIRDALLSPYAAHSVPSTTHHVRVSFDGHDLDEFLAVTKQTREAFLARVAGLRLRARYLGFRAGFAYLDGWPAEWAMPRRPTSRPVLRGSFAIGGNVAGFYPIDTPGGWNLLGRTDVDFAHALAPGDVIVVEPSREPLAPPPQPKPPRLTLDDVEVLAAPLATLVTPRPDWSRVVRGTAPGGAFDAQAAALANAAVGNDATAPLLECAMSGPRLRFLRERFVAFCDPRLSVRVERVRAGEELAIGRIDGGLRGYLAIGTGKVDVERPSRDDDRRVIRTMRGPHDIGLSIVECEVTPQLDRVGIRLRPLERIDAEIPADLRSIGMQCGTVQLHPDGSLVAMGPEHPVTGGYLQPMTVLSGETWKLAQLVPGERITLNAQLPYA